MLQVKLSLPHAKSVRRLTWNFLLNMKRTPVPAPGSNWSPSKSHGLCATPPIPPKPTTPMRHGRTNRYSNWVANM